MSFESPIPVEQEQEEEKPRFKRSEALAVENPVLEQIRAYTKHVREMAEKTGKSVEQVVAEESAEVGRVGVKGFLEKLNN